MAIDAKRKPVKSILDGSFRYTSSAQTDLLKTFARLRREAKESREVAAPTLNVSIIRTTTGSK